MTLKARFTALIDQANTLMADGFAIPGMVESLALECDGRLISVWVRFDDGALTHQMIAASPLTVAGIINAAHCAFLVDYLDIDTGDEFAPDLIAYATGCQPPVTTEDGRPITHAGPGAIQ